MFLRVSWGAKVWNENPNYHLEAFSGVPFGGNPAAVMLLDKFLPLQTLLALAAENNLSETAFLVPRGTDFNIRWFTPLVEVPLCGHATLASAAVVMERLEPCRTRVVFHSASGPLTVTKSGPQYVLNFPARPSSPMLLFPELPAAIGVIPIEVLENEFNYLAVLEDEEQVRSLVPDFAAVARLPRPGLIVTARGSSPYDFVSRYFAPAKGIPEDPVTGGAHCMLVPYWSKQLGKSEFRAYQASRRGGELWCRNLDGRVELLGECAFYMQGEVEI